jgi:hypothetical protein
MRDALEEDDDPPPLACYQALARVVDTDPTYVFNDGDENGMTVTVQVMSGPFVGSEVAAMVAAPLGAGFESRPITSGQRVLVSFLDGHVDGLVVVTHTVPGGKENPIPTAIAGVDVVKGNLQGEHLVAPPKGCNVRFYIRGGAFLVRLKGKTPPAADGTGGFVGEFYIEGDDDAGDGSNTSIRLAMNPTTGKLSVRMRTADGAAIAVDDGVCSMTSPNGGNTLQVSDSDVRVLGNTFYVDVGTVVMNGSILMNVPPPVPPTTIGPAVIIGSLATPCQVLVNLPPGSPPVPGAQSAACGVATGGLPPWGPSGSVFIGV